MSLSRNYLRIIPKCLKKKIIRNISVRGPMKDFFDGLDVSGFLEKSIDVDSLLRQAH
ncbi:MAG: hypothetical protein KAR05_01270 [Candidatus Omnitrophica bacterium]|nr:hypothetical protein [Candidatus Omnitrophota bacterium]